jgi:4-hydroxybenzoyl-CoA thioesterase
MTYHSEIFVRFGYCDPAGIVFYPRYLEMFNNLVEDWCREAQLPFLELQDGHGCGFPTAHLEVDFLAPSYMGDTLTASLTVRKIGGSSLTLGILLSGPDSAARVRGTVVLVLTDMQSKRPFQIPDDVRSRISAYCEDAS